MPKKKQKIWKKMLRRHSNHSRKNSWMRLVKEHRSVITALVAIALCVGILAIFVPINPKAMEDPVDESISSDNEANLITGAQSSIAASSPISVSMSGPTKVAVGTQNSYKYVLKVKNTTKKTWAKASAQFDAAAKFNKSSLPYTYTKPNKDQYGMRAMATWDLKNIQAGETKTIDMWISYTSGSNWTISFVGVAFNVSNGYDNADMVVKQLDYSLYISVTGAPSKIKPNKEYPYNIKVENTGKKILTSVTVTFKDARFVALPYPANCTLIHGADHGDSSKLQCVRNQVKPGASRTISLTLVYPANVNCVDASVSAVGSPGGSDTAPGSAGC